MFTAACEAAAAQPLAPADPPADAATQQAPAASENTPADGMQRTTSSAMSRTMSAVSPDAPRADFVFAVRDGRLGSITITDHGATKRSITAPRWAMQYVDQLVVTAMAATEALVFIGDGNGMVYQWDSETGATMVVPTARKPVRSLRLAAPPPEQLAPDAVRGGGRGRLLLLYGDGTFAVRSSLVPHRGCGSSVPPANGSSHSCGRLLQVWDVNKALSITQSVAASTPAATNGAIAFASWLPLPAPLSRGTVSLFLLASGAVTLIDTAQSGAARSMPAARTQALRRLLEGETAPRAARAPLVAVDGEAPLEESAHVDGATLAPGAPCASWLCLPPARQALLQLIIQVRAREHVCVPLATVCAPTCCSRGAHVQAGTPVATIAAALHPDRGTAERGAHALLCYVLSISERAADITRPKRASDGDSRTAGLVRAPSASGLLAGDEEAEVELLRSFRLDRMVRLPLLPFGWEQGWLCVGQVASGA